MSKILKAAKNTAICILPATFLMRLLVDPQVRYLVDIDLGVLISLIAVSTIWHNLRDLEVLDWQKIRCQKQWQDPELVLCVLGVVVATLLLFYNTCNAVLGILVMLIPTVSAEISMPFMIFLLLLLFTVFTDDIGEQLVHRYGKKTG